MSLSLRLFSTVSALLLVSQVASAQSSGPRIPVDAKGFRAQQIREQWSRSAPPRAVSSPTTVSGTAASSMIGIRGPDGVVRYYPAVSGSTPAVTVVGPGQPASVPASTPVTPPAPLPKQ